MLKEFFLDKFEYDFYANKSWIRQLEEQEDSLSRFTIRSMSHILNVHHIWNQRLAGNASESMEWDELPVSWMQRLNLDNYQQTVEYLEQLEAESKTGYHSSEGVPMEKINSDILYHILNHSNYHRAQIVMDLKQHKLQYPSVNFIEYK